MKLYAIFQAVSTFGQTEAGCHTALGPEEIVAEAPILGERSSKMLLSQKIFMEKIKPALSIPCGGRYIDVPVEASPRGFAAVAEIIRARKNTQPHIVCGYRLVAAFSPPELAGAETLLDEGNLGYQAALLSGKA